MNNGLKNTKMCELRKEFEETELFKKFNDYFAVYYSAFGGYKFRLDYSECFFLNGAFGMFQELNK